MAPSDFSSTGVPPNLRELRVYQEAHAYAAAIARASWSFPREERFALADQLRRAATGVYGNIAEGHDRPTLADQLRFYGMAQSSLTETRAHTDQANVRGYLDVMTEADLAKRAIQVAKLLIALTNTTRRRLDAASGAHGKAKRPE